MKLSTLRTILKSDFHDLGGSQTRAEIINAIFGLEHCCIVDNYAYIPDGANYKSIELVSADTGKVVELIELMKTILLGKPSVMSARTLETLSANLAELFRADGATDKITAFNLKDGCVIVTDHVTGKHESYLIYKFDPEVGPPIDRKKTLAAIDLLDEKFKQEFVREFGGN